MKKKYLGLFALFAVALLGIGAVSAFGMGQGRMIGFNSEDRAEMEDFHVQVQEAIQNGDYEDWQGLMESRMTEEHFEEMQNHWNERETRLEGYSGEGEDFHREMMNQRMGGQRNMGNCPFA